MRTYYENKVFLVTGASGGIGRALAVALAKKGAHVLAMARTQEKLIALREEIGEGIHPFKGDVTQEKDCEDAVQAALGITGQFHGLIHNAGISMRGVALDSKKEVFRDLMEVNFFSMLNLYHPSIEHLRKTQGHLVAVSSVMGRYATQERSGYCASKHALQGFMDSVRLENLEQGIHTMVVSPGFVNTDIARNALGPDGKPLGKDGNATLAGLHANDVAETILKGLQKRKRDLYPAGFKEKLGLFFSKHAPGFLDKMLLKMAIK